MGFDTKNDNANVKTTYLKITAEKDAKDVIVNKYLSITKKVDGKYVQEHMKNEKGYPQPFFGYLKDIKINFENKINNAVAPVINFTFSDHDPNERYVLQLPFVNDKGKVNPNVFSFLNSIASIKKFGCLKLYIVSSEKDGIKNFTLNVRNHENFIHGVTPISEFTAPAKDSGLPDPTRVSWKYKYDEIPPLMVKKVIDGDEVEINNVKKHQQFFIDLIANEILPNVQKSEGAITHVETKESVAPTTTFGDDDGDLPF